ncbi:CRISPR-associated protein Cas4 [bacterium]|nr:CRISPR-associated protein Cas4 [bacterium]
MPYAEDDLLPLSGLQHLAFCERQWGLIHIEQVWSENPLTAEGRVLHDRAHEGGSELRGGVLTARAVRLRSLRLGLAGVADVVEFHRVDSAAETGPPTLATSLPGRRGLWRPFPVEYKHGRPKANRCDEIQICAQAMCLEEMLGITIQSGALFYGQIKHRKEVAFDRTLRDLTEFLAGRVHSLFETGATPAAVYESRKCKSCSLLDVCRPEKTASRRDASRYLARELEELEREDP